MDTEKLKILLIEDNPGDARLMRELLAETTDAPFRMEQVDTIAKGLARLAEGGVDVILLDLSLPDSQGLEGLDRIIAQTQVVPIVVLSGLSDEITAIKAVQTGAQDYLVKRTTDRNLLMRTIQHSIERQRLRVALRESEAHYRLLADNIADVVWTADSEARITFVSPSIERLLGYTVEEAMKLKISDILTPDSADQARRFVKWQIGLYARGSQPPPASMTLEHVRKDGSTVWAEVMLSFLQGEDGRIMGIMGATRDITERKKSEEALRESEQRYRMLAENMKDIIWTRDMDLKLTYTSPSVQEMSGYSVEEVMSMSLEESLTPASLQRIEPIISKVLAANEEGQGDFPESLVLDAELIHKDGSTKLVEMKINLLRDSAGNPSGYLGVTRDITERRKMEQELLRLSDAFRMSQDSILITDLQGVVVDFNEATLKLFGGTDRADLIGKSPADLLVQEELGKGLESMKQAREEGTVGIQEYYIERQDGSKLQVEVSAALFRDAHNEPVGFVVVVRDITERKKMEEALRESEERHRLYFENASDVIYSIDKELRVVSVSPSAERLLGYRPEEFVGKLMYELNVVAPEDMAEALADTQRVLSGERILSKEYQFIAKDGTRKFGDVSGAPIISSDGTVVAMVSVARDVTERKRMEEELLRLSDAVRMSKDGFVITDQEGRILEANHATVKMHGLENRADIIGRLATELVAPEDMEMVTDVMTQALYTGHVPYVEFGGLRNDGSKFLIEASISVIKDKNEQPTGYMGITRDITERKRMEEALRESEERFRAVFEGASLGIALVGFDRKVIGINPAFERALGYSLEEFGELTNLEYLHPDDAMMDADLYIEMLKGKRDHYTVDKRYIRKDGQVLWGRQNLSVIRGAEGKPRYFIAMVEDITERRRMETALMQSEHNYRILFESTFDGMLVTDVETVTVALANEALLKMFGFDSLKDAIGLNPIDLVHPEDRERTLGYFMEDAFGNSKPEIHEFRAITRDGREIWVSGTGRRIDYAGKSAVLSSIRDITERKRAEEEKRKLEEQIQLAGRLAAVGELAAGVAHELNNPIAAIKGFAQLLAAREDVDVGVKKDLQTIFMESQRASKITQNMLTFARRHEPEKRFMSINEALERTLEVCVHQLKVNNIELEAELDRNLPKTMADFYQMQQIFLNIINNAEQAMVEVHHKGKLVVRTRKAGGMAQISFTDDGPGISEENLKRIFDPFFTTKEVGKGTGLGLSICYGLVEAHCGRIYAKSKPGQGAIFVVEIPIVTEEQAKAESALPDPDSRGVRWKKQERRY